MELWQVPLSFSRLRMFPFFDLAHYVASVLALKEQRGERGRDETGQGGRHSPPSQSRCYPGYPDPMPSPGRVRMGLQGEPPSLVPCGRADGISAAWISPSVPTSGASVPATDTHSLSPLLSPGRPRLPKSAQSCAGKLLIFLFSCLFVYFGVKVSGISGVRPLGVKFVGAEEVCNHRPVSLCPGWDLRGEVLGCASCTPPVSAGALGVSLPCRKQLRTLRGSNCARGLFSVY